MQNLVYPISFINSSFLSLIFKTVLTSKFNEFNYIENEQKGFSILKLKENEEYFIEEISFDKVLSNSFVTNNVIQQSAEFITVFEMEDYVNDYDTIYVELSLIDMYNCQRFLFEYDYQLNEFVYKDICYNKKDSRTMYSVAKNKDFIFNP